MKSDNKVTAEGSEYTREKFCYKKVSFHLSLENLHLKTSCFRCEADSRYTRSIQICPNCCHQLKDFTKTSATNTKSCFHNDYSSTESLENKVQISQRGKDKDVPNKGNSINCLWILCTSDGNGLCWPCKF